MRQEGGESETGGGKVVRLTPDNIIEIDKETAQGGVLVARSHGRGKKSPYSEKFTHNFSGTTLAVSDAEKPLKGHRLGLHFELTENGQDVIFKNPAEKKGDEVDKNQVRTIVQGDIKKNLQPEAGIRFKLDKPIKYRYDNDHIAIITRGDNGGLKISLQRIVTEKQAEVDENVVTPNKKAKIIGLRENQKLLNENIFYKIGKKGVGNNTFHAAIENQTKQQEGVIVTPEKSPKIQKSPKMENAGISPEEQSRDDENKSKLKDAQKIPLNSNSETTFPNGLDDLGKHPIVLTNEIPEDRGGNRYFQIVDEEGNPLKKSLNLKFARDENGNLIFSHNMMGPVSIANIGKDKKQLPKLIFAKQGQAYQNIGKNFRIVVDNMLIQIDSGRINKGIVKVTTRTMKNIEETHQTAVSMGGVLTYKSA